MCGICGLIDFTGPPPAEEQLARMTATLRHRGPDDRGVFAAGPAGLGHTRLSIIDLTPTGRQPMRAEEADCTLVYNGEIYNHRELRAELEAAGVLFRGRSDTEVLLRAYLQWGADAWMRLKGMFAFALWDGRTQTLHAARDRFGIKPLYYARCGDAIVFGSEIKALLASERIEKRIDWAALHEFLFYGTTLGERTLFDRIRRLLPGYHLVYDREGVRTAPYASIHAVTPQHLDLAAAVDTTRAELERAVECHLVSDVPVGVFLSGGIDSSTVTAFASRHYESRLKTYAVGFDFDRGAGELPKARRIAKLFGTDHQELHIAGGALTEVIEQLVRAHDQPFGDAANIPLYLLARELRGAVKVVLQGDGGDEIFAGYRRYNVLSAEKLWRLLAFVGAPLWELMPRTAAYHRYRRFLHALRAKDAAMRMALLLTEEPLAPPPTRVLAAEARAQVDAHDPFARYRTLAADLAHLDPVARMLGCDASILLPDIFLEKVDRATMAHGIEVRVPLLDADLTAHVMSLPTTYKVRHGQKKRLLRAAMRGILPDEILDGPKTGFGVPYAQWLRAPLYEYMRTVLLDPSTLAWGILDSERLEALIAEHCSGRRNNGFLLYKLLQLALWHRFYLT